MDVERDRLLVVRFVEVLFQRDIISDALSKSSLNIPGCVGLASISVIFRVYVLVGSSNVKTFGNELDLM